MNHYDEGDVGWADAQLMCISPSVIGKIRVDFQARTDTQLYYVSIFRMENMRLQWLLCTVH